jgi:hypothetical protein
MKTLFSHFNEDKKKLKELKKILEQLMFFLREKFLFEKKCPLMTHVSTENWKNQINIDIHDLLKMMESINLKRNPMKYQNKMQKIHDRALDTHLLLWSRS